MEHIVLSPWGLFEAAGIVGKSVMIALAIASIWCWVLIVEGAWGARRLNIAARAARLGDVPPILTPMIAAGVDARAFEVPGETVGECRHRIAEAMHREARDIVAHAEGGMTNLAVISSVAPFVGLFGTVWGIMTSFAGIAEAQDTSLAVVAPGIAEALAATAYGLAAAIPATIGYNRIGAAFGQVAGSLSDFADQRSVRIVARSEATSPIVKEVA